jgi:hypothetical protein
MNGLTRITHYFALNVHAPDTQQLFMRGSYLFLLLNALYFFPIRGLMWGEYAMIMPWNPGASPDLNLAYLLDHRRSWAIAGYYVYLGSLLLVQFRLRWVLPRMLVFLTGVMLYYACIPAFNAAMLLFNLFAFYMLFMAPHAEHPVRRMVGNFAFLACKIQVVMVYALAGGYKLSGDTWLEGSSIFYALQLDHYTSGWMADWLIEQRVLLVFFNYFGLIYQLGFPIAVFVKRLRGTWLVLGCVFHASIAIGMHLPDFGLGMMVAYLLFVSNTRSAAWLLKAATILPLGRKLKNKVLE